MFLIAGMIIAVTKAEAEYGLFYSMLAGALVIIIYTAMKERKHKQEKRREKRRSKK
jgi:predicted glycosyltransferase